MIDSVAGRAGEAHAGAEQHHLRRRSRSSWVGRAVEATHEAAGAIRSRPAATTSLVPNRTASFGAEDRGDPDVTRDRQQCARRSDSGAVALEELEVLGEQEDEPEQREERRSSPTPLAAVKRRFRKQRTSSIGSSRAPLPGDEDGEQDRAASAKPARVRGVPSRGRAPR